MTITNYLVWLLPGFVTFLFVCILVNQLILNVKSGRKTSERSISFEDSNITGVRDSEPEFPDNGESSRNRSQSHITFNRWLSCPQANTETPKTPKRDIGIER